MNKQSLSGIRVLDFTNHISGPYCTKLLADFGADVIKIEKPITGDISRSIGPFPGQQKNLDKSGLFMYLNTNKRGITLEYQWNNNGITCNCNSKSWNNHEITTE